MIADRSNPVRTVSRTKWATCPEGTKSWIDGGSSQTWSTSQARNVLLIPRLNHDAPSSSRKIRLLGQAPRAGDHVESSLRAKRSNLSRHDETRLDCFVAVAPRNDGLVGDRTSSHLALGVRNA